MVRATYSRDGLGIEVTAPWGYYQPQEEGLLEYAGKQVIYTLGSACVEVSCCGHGSWGYARVEGYVVEAQPAPGAGEPTAPAAIDTVEDAADRAALAKLLQDKHPGVRVEFR